jgi:hypothetical protein
VRDALNRRLPALTHRNAPANIFKPTITHRLAIATAEMNAEREREQRMEMEQFTQDFGLGMGA